ncbi:MAG: thiol:disulfide interchange protein DsbA/DsbL [Pseudoalteromonas spongiae]|uniref:Thiol:disulfide interchange protein n=1 Tax=Pseudoalteromonas spongiae TaxID=298657 RepID=A0ABU8EN91_9GAMM|nr:MULTISPECIES: thiol:disulfide interchange protein DsbA/DsbL [Pseudoalteromonas]ATC97534.1 thiol:disulfide interchange protein DsbA [Pseudoalteromonas spongiae UST010723-006]MEC8325565.1 thiol:disulfide interchange protein DsbA/DsbL [Pseudomonadota bacterium]TMO83968.1 thiol:disulfide interchange protein DsbA/DsbL [Pseudoalteromonas spongiae]
MTKKLFLIVALIFPLALFAKEFTFEEGKHFSRIKTEKSEKPQVTEFFSYYCPHCYNFEMIAQRLNKELPADTFVKSHVNFLNGIDPKTQSLLSVGYLVAKQAGKASEASDAIFSFIHRNRGSFATIGDVRRLFVLNDIVTEEKFDQLAGSMAIAAQEQYMVEQQKRFSDLRALTGVPTFIVNDIYRIELTSIKSYDELKALVDYLLEK